MNAIAAEPTDSAERFPSLGELESAHAFLVKASPDLVANPAVATGFIARTVATGELLDSPEDRTLAQGLINFWLARLSTAERTAAKRERESRCESNDSESLESEGLASRRSSSVPAFEKTVLKPFDAGTLEGAKRAADAWLAEPGTDRELVRRILLRLIRLRPKSPAFDAIPTVQVALNDLDAPEKVSAVLDRLVATGVVRRKLQDPPELNQYSLRSAGFIENWGQLVEWKQGRLGFRSDVEAWIRDGKPEETLAVGEPLEDARRYNDRNSDERDFVNASLYRQARRLESAASERKSKLIWRTLAVVAIVGWVAAIFGLIGTTLERRNAEGLNRDLSRVNGDISKVNGELGTAKDALEARLLEVKKANGEAEIKRQELRKSEALLKRRGHLADLRLLVRNLAELATARTVEERAIAERRWDVMADQIPREETYRPLRALNLVRMRKNAADPTTKKKIIAEDIKLIVKLRDEFLGGDTAEESRRLARDQSFAVVEGSAKALVQSLEAEKTFVRAESFARSFWAQYWGEMLLVEGPKVESAMVDFGEVLSGIQALVESPDLQMQGEVEKVLKRPLNPNEKKFVDSIQRLNPAAIAQAQSKPDYKEITETISKSLVKFSGDRTVPADRVKALKDQLKNLVDSLATERGKPIQNNRGEKAL